MSALVCACGHDNGSHTSDITGSGNSPCWESLTLQVDDHGYPINRCTCNEYNPAETEEQT
jgi:hypothetical protein